MGEGWELGDGALLVRVHSRFLHFVINKFQNWREMHSADSQHLTFSSQYLLNNKKVKHYSVQ